MKAVSHDVDAGRPETDRDDQGQSAAPALSEDNLLSMKDRLLSINFQDAPFSQAHNWKGPQQPPM